MTADIQFSVGISTAEAKVGRNQLVDWNADIALSYGLVQTAAEKAAKATGLGAANSNIAGIASLEKAVNSLAGAFDKVAKLAKDGAEAAAARSQASKAAAKDADDEGAALNRIVQRMREAKAAREAQAQAADKQRQSQEALNAAVAAGAGGKVSNAGLLASDAQSIQKATEAVVKLSQARATDAAASAKASGGVVRDTEAQTIALARLDARLGLITKSDLAYATAEAELSRLLRQGTIDADQHASRLAVLNKALDDGRVTATSTAAAHVKLTGAARDTFDAISAGGSPVGAIVMQFSSLEKGITAANVAMLAMGAGVGAIAGGIALLAAASIKAGDELTKTEGRLAAVTGSVGAARETYDGLYQISQKTGISVADSANQFVRFNIAAGEIGATRREVLQLVETVQKFGVVSGISTQEAQAGAQQLGQALASGKLQGDELRSILENMPVMARALAKELGVGIGQLKEMGSAGELTADKVFRALLRASAEANAAFEAMPMTVERASSIMASSWGRFVAEIDRSLQRSQSLANTIKYVADQLDRLAKNQTTSGQFDNISKQITELEAYKKQLKQELSDNNGWGFSVGTFLKNNSELADIDKRIARLQATRDVLGENVREEQRLAAQMQQSDRARTASAAAAAAQTAAQGAYKDAVKGLFPLEDALTERNKKRADVMSALDAGLISFAQAQKDNAAIEEAYQAKVESVTHAQRDAEKAAGDREKAEAKLEKQILSAVKAADAKAVEEYNKVMNEGKRVYDSTRTPAEKYADTLVDLNRLLNAGAIDQDTFNRAVQQSDPAFQEAKKAAEKYQQEIQSTAKDIARDWSETLYDAMILQDKQASIIDAIKALGKRIAVALLEANIVLPITTSIVGSMPGLFGIQGGGSAANQNGGMGGLGGQALSLGSKFMPSSWTSGITSSIDNFGYSALGIGSQSSLLAGQTVLAPSAEVLAQQTAMLQAVNPGLEIAAAPTVTAGSSGGAAGGVAAGTGLSAYLGAAGIGLGAGMLLPSLLGIQNKATGGLVGAGGGAAAGALAGTFLFPGIGTALGALLGGGGGLLGGLLGTQKPSVGKTASSDVTISNGVASYGNVLTDNSGDAAAGQALGQAVAAIFNAAKAGGGSLTKDFGFGQTEKGGYYVGGSVPMKEFKDDFAGMVRYALLDQGGLQGGGENTLAALRNSTNKDAGEFGKDVALGASIDAGITALAEFDKSLKGVENAAKKAAEANYANAIAEKERADGLGIGAAYADLLTRQIRESFNPETLTPLKSALAALDGQFAALTDAVHTMGLSISDAEIAAAKAAQAEKLLQSYRNDFDTALRAAQGLSSVDQAMAIRGRWNANWQDDLAAGRDPNTLYAAQMKALFGGIEDLSTLDKAAAALQSLDTVAAGFAKARADEVKAQLEQTAATERQAEASKKAADAANAFASASSSTRSYLLSLMAGTAGGLSASDRYRNAQGEYASASAAIGPQATAEQLARQTEAAKALIEASRAVNGSTTEYFRDLANVSTDLAKSAQITPDDPVVTAINALKASVDGLGGSINVEVTAESIKFIRGEIEQTIKTYVSYDGLTAREIQLADGLLADVRQSVTVALSPATGLTAREMQLYQGALSNIDQSITAAVDTSALTGANREIALGQLSDATRTINTALGVFPTMTAEQREFVLGASRDFARTVNGTLGTMPNLSATEQAILLGQSGSFSRTFNALAGVAPSLSAEQAAILSGVSDSFSRTFNGLVGALPTMTGDQRAILLGVSDSFTRLYQQSVGALPSMSAEQQAILTGITGSFTKTFQSAAAAMPSLTADQLAILRGQTDSFSRTFIAATNDLVLTDDEKAVLTAKDATIKQTLEQFVNRDVSETVSTTVMRDMTTGFAAVQLQAASIIINKLDAVGRLIFDAGLNTVRALTGNWAWGSELKQGASPTVLSTAEAMYLARYSDIADAWASDPSFDPSAHYERAGKYEGRTFANGGIMTPFGELPLHAYSSGGVANTPQMAIFGEGRMAEAYVPLPDGRTIPVTMRAPANSNRSTDDRMVEELKALREEVAALRRDNNKLIQGQALMEVEAVDRQTSELKTALSSKAKHAASAA